MPAWTSIHLKTYRLIVPVSLAQGIADCLLKYPVFDANYLCLSAKYCGVVDAVLSVIWYFFIVSMNIGT
jgi:hypothetical protein